MKRNKIAVQMALCQIDVRSEHPRHTVKDLFDARHAGGAGHPFHDPLNFIFEGSMQTVAATLRRAGSLWSHYRPRRGGTIGR